MRATVGPAQVGLDMPRTTGPGSIGFSDPWFELLPEKVTSCVSGWGVIQRYPGRTIGDLPGWVDFMADRWDGWSSETAAAATFVDPKATDYAIQRYGKDWQQDTLD